MHRDYPEGAESLSLSVAQRIDLVCTRFEAAWQEGRRPRLEDFLGEAQGAERETLLWELLRIEIDFRLRQGDPPRVEEYQSRFAVPESLLREEIEARLVRAAGRPAQPDTMQTEAEGTAVLNAAFTVGPVPEIAVPGYEAPEPLGEGGMAKVYRVHDPAFDRSLAIKVMKANRSHPAEAEQRFLAEARITGRLQHPGIPPVHEIGRLADGRPFLAMKLIEGDTLYELLKRRPTPASELPRFVAIFGQLCQAVGYAHSQGVIHRDLKPSNIMVGAFGEVQVMDWGLARELASPERENAIVGTPGFMAPEQARAEGDTLDERADVFGLGAILCVILTGEPPFVGVDGSDILRQASAGKVETAFARLGACAADAELIGLAMRCLAPDPGQRPRDGSAVATAVQAYQTGVEERARKAQTERAAAQARVEEAMAKAKAERRARLLTLGLAAALLLMVIGGGVGAWIIQLKTAANAQAVRTALGQGRSLLDQGWAENKLAKLLEAKAAVERALDVVRSSNAGSDLRHEATELLAAINEKIGATERNNAGLAAWLNLRRRSRETDSYTKTSSGATTVDAEPSAEEQLANAFRHWGVNPDREPLEDVVARLQAQPAPVVQEIVNCLDSWALHRRRFGKFPEARWRPLLAIAERLDTEPGRKKLRRLLASSPLGRTSMTAAAWEKARADLLEESKKVNPAAEPVQSLLARVRALDYFDETVLAEELLRSSLARHPREVGLLVALGRLLEDQPSRLEQAAGCFRAARSLRPELGIALGRVLMQAGQAWESIAVFEDLKRLLPATPDLDFYLGNALRALGKLEASEAAYKRAIRLKPAFFEAYNNLGTTLRAQKKLDEAVAAYHKGIALNRQALERYPQLTELRHTLAMLHSNLGVVLESQKKHDEAVAAYRTAIKQHPALAVAYNNLGIALQTQKKFGEAVDILRKAIEVQPDFAVAYSNLGTTLYEQKKPDEAVAAFRTALKLKPGLAGVWYNLGKALRTQKKLDEAVLAFHQALRLQGDFVEAHHDLGLALADQNRLDEAADAFRQAIKYRPAFADAYHNLGNALYHQKKLGEAVAAFKKALELDPRETETYLGLANALQRQQKLDEAADVLRRAIKVKRDFGAAYFNLGNILRAQQKLEDAVTAFRKAIEVQPDLVAAYVNLGNTLRTQQKLEEAEDAYRGAIRLNPRDPEGYNNLGVVLRDQQKPEEAVAAYRKGIALTRQALELYPQIIALRRTTAWLYNNMGVALEDQKKLGEAVAAFRQADQLRPNQRIIRRNRLHAERWLELDRKLPLIQAKKAQPNSAQERIELANFCLNYRPRYAAAVGFFADAFSADSKLAGDWRLPHRYLAATAAVLAAAAKGEDAGDLSDKQRGKLLRQARDWLRADLAVYTRLMGKEDPKLRQALRQRLSFWLRDDNLATVRDAVELAVLPEPERKAWQQLWEDVAELMKKCR